MSTTPAPYRSNLPAGGGGFLQLLHAEWTKFRTVRGWMVALVVAGLLVVLMAYLATFHHQNFVQAGPGSPVVVAHPFVPLGPSGETVTDTFYFVHQSLQGNGSITVRLSSLTGLIEQSSGSGSLGQGHSQGSSSQTQARPGLVPWAKAGIIVKDSTRQGSAYAALMVTGAHGVRLQYDYTHDIAGPPAAVSTASARWLRLSRFGDVLSGSESTDGAHWTTVGSIRLAGLPQTVQAGLFVTSPPLVPSRVFASPSASSATAFFDQVSLAGHWPHNTWSGLGVGAGSVGAGTVTPTLGTGGFRQAGDTFAVTGSGDIAPAVGDVGYTPYESLQGVFVGLLMVIVLGALFITAEYRRGLIRSSFAASPRRGRVLAAKALVLGAATFAVGLIAAAIALSLGDRLLRATGNYLYPVSALTELRVMLGTAALFALAAVLALALGAILRRGAGVVAAGIVLFVLPSVLGASYLPTSAEQWLLRLTPAAGYAIQQSLVRYPQVSYAYTAANGYFPLAPWAGFAVLCAYGALALGLAFMLLRRRDA